MNWSSVATGNSESEADELVVSGLFMETGPVQALGKRWPTMTLLM